MYYTSVLGARTATQTTCTLAQLCRRVCNSQRMPLFVVRRCFVRDETIYIYVLAYTASVSGFFFAVWQRRILTDIVIEFGTSAVWRGVNLTLPERIADTLMGGASVAYIFIYICITFGWALFTGASNASPTTSDTEATRGWVLVWYTKVGDMWMCALERQKQIRSDDSETGRNTHQPA